VTDCSETEIITDCSETATDGTETVSHCSETITYCSETETVSHCLRLRLTNCSETERDCAVCFSALPPGSRGSRRLQYGPAPISSHILHPPTASEFMTRDNL